MRQPETGRRHLPRLERPFYRGCAYIHWTLTVRDRQKGWLTAGFHRAFREILAHTQSRYFFLCPSYCLMPDHIHLLWLGVAECSDQIVAMEFFRKHLKPFLVPASWQEQAHDHVLREDDRERGAFQTVAWYVLSNPVRGDLVSAPELYDYSGCVVLGYPDLSPFQADYWDCYWRINNRLRDRYGALE